jgi:hypothetical protein
MTPEIFAGVAMISGPIRSSQGCSDFIIYYASPQIECSINVGSLEDFFSQKLESIIPAVGGRVVLNVLRPTNAVLRRKENIVRESLGQNIDGDEPDPLAKPLSDSSDSVRTPRSPRHNRKFFRL